MSLTLMPLIVVVTNLGAAYAMAWARNPLPALALALGANLAALMLYLWRS